MIEGTFWRVSPISPHINENVKNPHKNNNNRKKNFKKAQTDFNGGPSKELCKNISVENKQQLREKQHFDFV